MEKRMPLERDQRRRSRRSINSRPLSATARELERPCFRSDRPGERFEGGAQRGRNCRRNAQQLERSGDSGRSGKNRRAGSRSRRALWRALHAASASFRNRQRGMTAKLDGLLGPGSALPDPAAQKAFDNGKIRRAIIAPACRRLRRNCAPGRPTRRCRGIAASLRFSLGAIGSRPVSGRIGTASSRCWSARFMVSVVALVFAVPLGVAAAIYVSEIARPARSASSNPTSNSSPPFPRSCLGFFGIAVVGQAVRARCRNRIG